MGSIVTYNEQSRAFTRPLSDNPEITVVIPCYAQAHFLSEALDSVMRSRTERALDVIVVDDGSPDNVAFVALRYIGVTFAPHTENFGVSCARNTGISLAKGTYVVTLDADDALLPDALEDWAQALDDNPTYHIVYGDHELFGTVAGTFRNKEASWEVLSKEPCIPSAAMQRREVWEMVRDINGTGYDPDQPYGWEDALYYLEAYCLGIRALKIDKPCFRYRIQDYSRNQIAAMKEKEIRAYQRERIKRLYNRDVYPGT